MVLFCCWILARSQQFFCLIFSMYNFASVIGAEYWEQKAFHYSKWGSLSSFETHGMNKILRMSDLLISSELFSALWEDYEVFKRIPRHYSLERQGNEVSLEIQDFKNKFLGPRIRISQKSVFHIHHWDGMSRKLRDQVVQCGVRNGCIL